MTPNEQTAVEAILDAIQIISQTFFEDGKNLGASLNLDNKVKEARTLLEASPTVPVSQRYTITYTQHGHHAETIEEDGRTVLWLNPGTERGEENVHRIVDLLNRAAQP